METLSNSNLPKEEDVRKKLLSVLFQRILETFAEMDPFNKKESPTFFLVYAHDNTSIGNADAALARHLISWLKILRSKVISDRSVLLEPCAEREEIRAAHDILENQFCILPNSDNPGNADKISAVDKVILCSSEVLQSYYDNIHMRKYTQNIIDFYRSANENSKSRDEIKKGIEGIVREYLDEDGFHHVVTELAFLEIRREKEGNHHSIIPIVFNGNGIKYLEFIDTGVPLYLTRQKGSKSLVHEGQALHRLFFNLLRQMYKGKHQAIDGFSHCYEECAKMLSPGSSLPPRESFEGSIQVEINKTLEALNKGTVSTIRTVASLKAVSGPCLKSLAFPEMDYRRNDAERAHANTCHWIISHNSYINWLKEGSGILWIRGKPGSGKSTLMEVLHRDFKKRADNNTSIRLSFFFHGRGSLLQKSRLGMFRSLLHQLLSHASDAGADLQHEFEEKVRTQGDPGKHWDWHINELRDFFMSAVKSVAKTQLVNIFIDALDEADDGTNDGYTTPKVFKDFHELNNSLDKSRFRPAICFSCRHLRAPKTNSMWEIWVEKENHADIFTYVGSELNRSLSSSIEDQYLVEWQETIVDRAQGLFQWASLVVDMIIKWHNDGRSPREIGRMLADVPEELAGIYERILTKDIDKKDNQQTLCLMRWVLLAVQPLSITEGYIAMSLPSTELLSSDSDFSLTELDFPTIDTMIKRIVSLSGGLIECKDHEGGQIIQFIHQSVNDFLSKGGLGLLEDASREHSIGKDLGLLNDTSREHLIGKAHLQLSLICLNCIIITQRRTLNPFRSNYFEAKLPIVSYATKFWFQHAEKADTRGVSSDYFLLFDQRFPKLLEKWISLYKSTFPSKPIFSASRYNNKEFLLDDGSNMLHTASWANLLTVVQGLLSISYDVEKADGAGNRAIHYASLKGHARIVEVLLNAGAIVEAENNGGSTALEIAVVNGHEEVVSLLLKDGANVNQKIGTTRNVLYEAAAGGIIAVVRTLLAHKADINAEGGKYGNALQVAVYGCYQEIVQLLLDRGANVNAQGGYYGNALQAAVYKGYRAVVELLLDRGADVNAQGGYYGNALQAAIHIDRKEIFQLLLDRGVNVNAQGGYYDNALQAAVDGCYREIVQLLLDRGANVNAEGEEYGNALQAAAYEGYKAVVELLLDRGADVNAQRGKYGNALQAAVNGDHQEIFQLLLDKGADIAQRGYYGNALQAAIHIGRKEIFQLLLDRGVDINRQDNQGRYPIHHAIIGNKHTMIDFILAKIGTPNWNYQDRQGCSALHFAASGGSNQILKTILKSDIDINILDTNGWTPLHWACRGSRHETALLLIDSGADFSRKDRNGWTPQDVAIFCDDKWIGDLQDEKSGLQLEPLITESGKNHYVRCSFCYYIFGTLYKCKSCYFLYFCFRCIVDAERIHEKGHIIEEVN